MLNTLQAFLEARGHVLLFRGPHGPAEPHGGPAARVGRNRIRLLDTLQSRLTILEKRHIGAECSTWNIGRGALTGSSWPRYSRLAPLS